VVGVAFPLPVVSFVPLPGEEAVRDVSDRAP
jgi:hypothetical protein